MSKTYVDLGATPIKITSGTNYAFIQALGGNSFSWADGATSPDTNLVSHSSMELSVSPPYVIWIWNKLPKTIPVVYSVAG